MKTVFVLPIFSSILSLFSLEIYIFFCCWFDCVRLVVRYLCNKNSFSEIPTNCQLSVIFKYIIDTYPLQNSRSFLNPTDRCSIGTEMKWNGLQTVVDDKTYNLNWGPPKICASIYTSLLAIYVHLSCTYTEEVENKQKNDALRRRNVRINVLLKTQNCSIEMEYKRIVVQIIRNTPLLCTKAHAHVER